MVKKIISGFCIVLCACVFIVYFLSCFSYCIPSSSFSNSNALAILFPYLLILALLLICVLFLFTKKISIGLLVLVLLLGFKNVSNSFAFNLPKWEMKKGVDDIRIMTWNIENFANSKIWRVKSIEREKFLTVIYTYNPDVICLQEFKNVEAHGRSIEKQEFDSLGYKYSFISNDSIDYSRARIEIKGVAIFSKTPFIDSGRININNNKTTENLIYTDVSFNAQPIRIFTAHLISFGLDNNLTPESKKTADIKYSSLGSIRDKLAQTAAKHDAEVSIIRHAIDKSPYPVVYCGDINSVPTSHTYNSLKQNLADAFLSAGSGTGVTFFKILHTLRIDVCLIDKKIKAKQCTVPHLYLSDHFPVITDVGFAK